MIFDSQDHARTFNASKHLKTHHPSFGPQTLYGSNQHTSGQVFFVAQDYLSANDRFKTPQTELLKSRYQPPRTRHQPQSFKASRPQFDITGTNALRLKTWDPTQASSPRGRTPPKTKLSFLSLKSKFREQSRYILSVVSRDLCTCIIILRYYSSTLDKCHVKFPYRSRLNKTINSETTNPLGEDSLNQIVHWHARNV
jgi:hypothetical protein